MVRFARESSVGIEHDTAAFAVNSIRRWWYMLGRAPLRASSMPAVTLAFGQP
jgi:Rhodopirellula transposase DDE domain